MSNGIIPFSARKTPLYCGASLSVGLFIELNLRIY
jgi:hypothetical protein